LKTLAAHTWRAGCPMTCGESLPRLTCVLFELTSAPPPIGYSLAPLDLATPNVSAPTGATIGLVTLTW
jgi:hypothetical protein